MKSTLKKGMVGIATEDSAVNAAVYVGTRIKIINEPTLDTDGYWYFDIETLDSAYGYDCGATWRFSSRYFRPETFVEKVISKRPKPFRPGDRIKYVIPMGTYERKGTVDRVVRVRACALDTIVVRDDVGGRPLYITRRQITKRLKAR